MTRASGGGRRCRREALFLCFVRLPNQIIRRVRQQAPQRHSRCPVAVHGLPSAALEATNKVIHSDFSLMHLIGGQGSASEPILVWILAGFDCGFYQRQTRGSITPVCIVSASGTSLEKRGGHSFENSSSGRRHPMPQGVVRRGRKGARASRPRYSVTVAGSMASTAVRMTLISTIRRWFYPWGHASIDTQ